MLLRNGLFALSVYFGIAIGSQFVTKSVNHFLEINACQAAAIVDDRSIAECRQIALSAGAAYRLGVPLDGTAQVQINH